MLFSIDMDLMGKLTGYLLTNKKCMGSELTYTRINIAF